MPSPTYRYGLFLRPPAILARHQAAVHDLLRRQYGLVTAGAFPPHMTILGHVPTADDHGAVVDAASAALTDVTAVRFFNRGVVPHQGGVAYDVGTLATGEPNPELTGLFRRARRHLDPLRVDVTNEFKGGVTQDKHFYGHMTLAGHDLALRPELFDEVYSFLLHLDIQARGEYVADTVALYAFRTRTGWDGAWWETMTWTLLRSYHLG